jgi:outer membrane autotransporter protein
VITVIKNKTTKFLLYSTTALTLATGFAGNAMASLAVTADATSTAAEAGLAFDGAADDVYTIDTDSHNITAATTTDVDNMGAILIGNGTGGTITVTGDVGTSTKALSKITMNIAAETATFNNNVYVGKIAGATGAGTMEFKGNIAGGTNVPTTIVDTAGQATVINLTGAGKTYTAKVETTGGGASGIVRITGGTAGTTQTWSGAIGASAITGLAELSAGGSGTVAFGDKVYATNIYPGYGTTAPTVTIAGTSEFTEMEFKGAATVTLSGDSTGLIDFNGKAGTLTLASGVNHTGQIDDDSSANNATLTLAGGTQTISNMVGDTNALKVINAGADSATSTFSNTVDAQTFNVTGSGTVTITGAAVMGTSSGQGLVYGGAGTVTLTAGMANGRVSFGNYDGTLSVTANDGGDSAITATKNNVGTINMNSTAAQTVGGAVGSSTYKIKAINVGSGGTLGVTTFSSTVDATTVTVNGTGGAIFSGNTSTALSFTGNGTVKLGTGVTFTGNMTNDTGAANQGTLTLNTGTINVVGTVGSSSAPLSGLVASSAGAVTGKITGKVYTNTITEGAHANTITFSDDVSATTSIKFSGASTYNFNGNVSTALVDFNDVAGVVVIADGKNLAGVAKNVAASANKGTVTFLGSTSVAYGLGSSTTNTGLVAVNFNGSGNATLAADIYATTTTVASTATLTLSGTDQTRTVNGTTLALNGTLDLGTNTLSTDSAVTPGTSSVIKLTLGDTSAADGKISTTGSAVTLNGTNFVVTANRYIPNATAITVIDSTNNTSVNTKSTATSTAMLTWTPSISGKNVILTAARTSGGYGTVATTATTEGKAMGDILEAMGSDSSISSGMRSVLGQLDSMTSASQLATALDKMRPHSIASTVQAVSSMTDGAAGTISARLASLSDNNVQLASLANSYIAEKSGISTGSAAMNGAIWAQGFGSKGDQDNYHGQDGFKMDAGGITVGADKPFSDCLRLGVAFSYGGTKVKMRDSKAGDKSDMSSYQFSMYGGYEMDSIVVNGLVSGGFHNIKTARDAGLGARVIGDHDAYQFGGQVEAGYRVDLGGGFTGTPLAGLQYAHLDEDGYTEKGHASLAQIVSGKRTNILKSGLGAQLAYKGVSGNWDVMPEVHAKWAYDLLGKKPSTTAAFAGATNRSFVVTGPKPARSGVNMGASLTMADNSKGMAVTLNYDAEMKSKYRNHTGMLKVKVNF